MSQPGTVLALHPKQHAHLTPYLAAIHASCITHDRAMATFLPPLSHEKLLTWWKDRISEVAAGKRRIWILVVAAAAATVADTELAPRGPDVMGVVMLSAPSSETGARRASVEKLLVHKNFRNRGAARALMAALEREALSVGKSILLLDTEADGPAERVFGKLGWVKLGRVPAYGTSPMGEVKDGMFFYKQLS